jgi:hypothetical protein
MHFFLVLLPYLIDQTRITYTGGPLKCGLILYAGRFVWCGPRWMAFEYGVILENLSAIFWTFTYGEGVPARERF